MGAKVKKWWLATTRRSKFAAVFAAVLSLAFSFSLFAPTRASAAAGDDHVQMTASFVSCQITGDSLSVSYRVINDNPTVGYVRTFDTYPGSPVTGDELAHKTVPANSATGTVLTFSGLPHADLTHEINVGATNDEWHVYSYQMGDFFVNPSQCSGQPVAKHVTAPKPTKVDAYGTANDTYTIPSLEGVQYYVDGQPVAPNTYSTKGALSINVTAKAKDGYVLDNANTAKWTLVFTDVPAPPPCLSDLSGVQGTVAHTSSGSVTYTATLPKPACSDLKVYGDTYTLPSTYDGSGDWNASAAPQHYVPSARAVLVIAKGQTSATATKSFASALKCGTNWLQDDTYTGPQQDTVYYPQGSNGYLAGGPFKVVYDGQACHPTQPKHVTATAPASVDECGTANDTYTIPSTEGVQYYVDGKVVSARTYPTNGASKVKVTAKAKDGYVLEGKSSWTLKFTDKPCTTPPPAQNPSIKAKASCGQVKYSNPNGFAVEVWYGDKSGKVDGSVVVPAHGSKVVKTSRTTLYYVIGWKGFGAGDKVYSVKVKQDCNTTPPTSPTTEPTSPSSSPTSPSTSPSSSPSSTSTGTPTSTSTSTPTSTATGTSTSTGSSSSKPGHSNSSTATSTSKSSRPWTTASSSSKTTGPKIVTDGPQSPSSGSNAGVLLGGALALLGAAAVVFGLRRRLSDN